MDLPVQTLTFLVTFSRREWKGMEERTTTTNLSSWKWTMSLTALEFEEDLFGLVAVVGEEPAVEDWGRDWEE